MNKYWGTATIFLACLITFNFWLISKENISVITLDPLLSISQIISLLGVVLISISLVLTTKLKALERIFGGLDKTYQTHRITGGIAFVLVINHPLLLAAKTAATPSISLTYLIPGQSLAMTSGVLAAYLFILAFIFLVFIRLPYHLWKWVHRGLGVGFLLSAVHIFTIGSDIGRSLFLRGWVLSFIFLGVSSVIYTVFLYKRFGPRHFYVISKLERSLDVINIWLKPVKYAMSFDPGQFVYVKFKTKETGLESHPFSLSSASYEEGLRLSVKVVGDYTLKLPNLKEGDQAEVYGPYGFFGKPYLAEAKDLCWVAGGIGVTPFLSMLRNEYRVRSDKNITFFYCYKKPEEGVFVNEINYLIQELKNVQFINWCSQDKGRLDAKKIAQIVADLPHTHISMCGPQQMMKQLEKQLLGLGVLEKYIYSEKFQLV